MATDDEGYSSHAASIASCQAEASESEPPLVLQCAQCNVIIGDTTSWVGANAELRTITLNSVTDKVHAGTNLKTSCEESDLGSTYVPLRCVSCKNELGRIYKTTSRHLDDIRDRYTVYANKITSYQIGSQQQKQKAEGEDSDDPLGLPGAKFLYIQLRKTQSLILTLNQRVKSIEESLEFYTDEEGQRQGENQQDGLDLLEMHKEGESDRGNRKNKATDDLESMSLKRKKIK